jgi:hypothetical protein
MFSIPTFPKLVILVAVIVLVYMWSKRNMVQSRGGQGSGSGNGKAQGKAPPAGTAPRNAAAKTQTKAIEDLVKCPSCGTYIAAGSRCDCGQGGR